MTRSIALEILTELRLVVLALRLILDFLLRSLGRVIAHAASERFSGVLLVFRALEIWPELVVVLYSERLVLYFCCSLGHSCSKSHSGAVSLCSEALLYNRQRVSQGLCTDNTLNLG